MKPIGITTALAVLTLAGCEKFISEHLPKPTPQPIATPALATRQPIAAVTPPATPAPELAPPGVFYLRVSKSITTKDGIVGFAPGTMLRRTSGGEYLTVEGQVVRASKNEVTNRMDEVRQLATSGPAKGSATPKKAKSATATPSKAQGNRHRTSGSDDRDDVRKRRSQ